MKQTFYLVLFSMFCFPIYANHVWGGELSFKYIGDSTGVAHQYEATIKLFASANNSGNANIQLNLSTACFGAQTFFIPKKAGGTQPLNSGFECVLSASSILNLNEIVYQGVLTLPGACAYNLFTVNLGFRGNLLDNISNEGQLILNAFINNSKTNASTPIFKTVYNYKACSNAPFEFNLPNEVSAAITDSIAYELVTPIRNTNNNTVNWSAGYSLNSPFTSATATSFNSNTGLLSYQPTQAEWCVYNVQATQYLYDSVTTAWYIFSTIMRELTVETTSTCVPEADNWNLLLTDSTNNPNDTIFVNCNTNVINLVSSVPILRTSISSDVSEFRLHDGLSSLIPIKTVQTNTSGNFYTNDMYLTLQDSLFKNDTLVLVSRTGTDGNSFINQCGYELNQPDSLYIIVQNCSGIGLKELSSPLLSNVYPNPAQSTIHLESKAIPIREVEIYSLSGLKVLETTITNNRAKLELSTLPKGVYMISVKFSDERTEQHKIIVQ